MLCTKLKFWYRFADGTRCISEMFLSAADTKCDVGKLGSKSKR
jgi:hypothetical protein